VAPRRRLREANTANALEVAVSVEYGIVQNRGSKVVGETEVLERPPQSGHC